MSTLSQLAALLAGDVPATGGVPTTAQYEQAIADAAADFGRRCPRRLIGTLSVVAGTAAYALPTGFQRMIRFPKLQGGAVMRDASGALVPFSSSFAEDYVIDGGQLTLYPTPGYTLDRQYVYSAGYPFVTDSFVGLSEDYERVLLLKAQSILLRSLGNESAGGFSYQIGDVRVDKKSIGMAYATKAADAETAYMDAITAINGKMGMRGDYRLGESL